MGTRIDMIGVFVTDLARMVAFYRDVLGFEITWDGSGPYAEFVNEGVRFAMYERAQLPGLLLDVSARGATAFVEPLAVVELNNRLTAAPD